MPYRELRVFKKEIRNQKSEVRLKKVKIKYQTNLPVIAVSFRIIIVLIFYAVCRFLFFIFNKDSFDELSLSNLFYIFYGGLKFDLVPIVYSNSIYVIAFLLPFRFVFNKFYKYFWNTIFIITNSIAILISLADIIYYNTNQNRLTFPVIKSVIGENKLASMFFRYLGDYWYLSLVLLLIILGMVFSIKIIDFKFKESKNKTLSFIKNLIILILSVGIMFGFARGTFIPSDRPISFGNAGKFVNNPNQISIVLNSPFCLIKSYTTNELEELHYFTDSIELNSYCNPFHKANTAIKNRHNIVIIVLESFGQEYIGSLNPDLDSGNYKGYTPFLDSLISKSYVFCNAFSNGRKSIDALPAIIASIPSLENPYIISPYVGNKITSVANLLKNVGYKSMFFHGAYNGSMGFDAFMNIAGFDKYYGYNEFPDKERNDGYWGIWDEDFFQFFANTMNQSENPFLGVIFSLSSHSPYDVPEEYQNKFPKGTLPIHETIGYADYSLKKFFETAEKMSWFDSTLFVITADHPSLVYHKEYNNDVAFFRVPIILYSPKNIEHKFDSTLVQHIDILPTIMNYIGYNKPYFSLGKDMLNDSIEHYVVINNIGAKAHCLIWKNSVLHYYDNNLNGIYDLSAKSLMTNIFEERKSLFPDMEKRYKAFLQQFNNSVVNNKMK